MRRLVDRYIFKQSLLLCFVALGTIFPQSSHYELTVELLKDLQRAIQDSTALPKDSLQYQFVNNSKVGSYLNDCLNDVTSGSADKQDHPIRIEASSLRLSVDQVSQETSRNSYYLRQLELKVVFAKEQNEYAWQGKISDKLSKDDLKNLLEEDYPVVARGNYLNGEPAAILVILTTLGVFSLGAALFFIRT